MQIATQCNEDALDADVQTEVPDALDKWTQHPQDGAFVSGGKYFTLCNNPRLNFGRAHSQYMRMCRKLFQKSSVRNLDH